MMRCEVGVLPDTKKLFYLGGKSPPLIMESGRNKSHLVMNSLEPELVYDFQVNHSIPDVVGQLDSMNLTEDSLVNGNSSVLLLDDKENLKITSEEKFLKALDIEKGTKVKVVSIFGNTGDGKSYALNQLFFNGEEVFKTSPSQTSCTFGVWAKYDPNLQVLCLDTEGLLGVCKHEKQRVRLLLKILAISDIVIFRTRSERVPNDMYKFLAGASKVFKEHISPAIRNILAKADGGSDKCHLGIGPGLIIFHQTRNTFTLDNLHDEASVTKSAEDIVRENFAIMGLDCDAFSFIKYVGVRTGLNQETSFDQLRMEVQTQLESKAVRSPRDAVYIFLALQGLSKKFQQPLVDSDPQQYLVQFFTCTEQCQSCNSGCSLSMGHKEEGLPHKCTTPCTFQHQYQNSVYLCEKCYKNGVHQIVRKDTSQTWLGYVIDCPVCGQIYCSRKYLYGNKEPEDEGVVRIETVHVWPGDPPLFGITHSAQRVVDGVAMIGDVLSSVATPPAKMLANWANRQIAPSYWRPDEEITNCFKCKVSFVPNGSSKLAQPKHHCRNCGEGFCESCSAKRCPVPSRGWGDNPVRVCDSCFEALEGRGQSLLADMSGEEPIEVRYRYIGEKVVNSISGVRPLLDIPRNLLKDSARPSYWTPDSDCFKCVLCNEQFGPLLLLHHCRDCGKGVCDNCSKARKSVPVRGWDMPVRVCDVCR